MFLGYKIMGKVFAIKTVLAIAGLAIQYVYAGDTKLLINKEGSAALSLDIATWSEIGCDKDERDVWKRYQYSIAMQNKFADGFYLDAHNIAIILSNYSNDHRSCLH
jgi:hypothetical protein